MRIAVVLIAFTFLTGCAPKKTSSSAAVADGGSPVTSSLGGDSAMPLRDVIARLATPSRLSTTQPATQPALAAIELYARARGATQQKEFYTAVNLLERAAELDPESAAIQLALGRAYGQIGGGAEKAVIAVQKAAGLEPDSLDTWLTLARLTVRGGGTDAALRALLHATQTSDYTSGRPEAIAVDFYLARMLQSFGYDGAAIELYEKLLKRSSRRTAPALRGFPEVAAALSRPEPMQLELAKLYQRRGRVDQSIVMYERVATSAPEVFDAQARVIRALLSAKRFPQATRRAADAVRQFEASQASVDLLLEAHAAAGDEGKAFAELRRLQRENPRDLSILTALAGLLSRDGRGEEAERLLQKAIEGEPADIDRLRLLRNLVEMQRDRGDTLAAARTLVEETVRRPHTAAIDLPPLWRTLVQPWRENALRADDLNKLTGDLPASAQSARMYWTARLAGDTGRDATARKALLEATRTHDAIFAPAMLLRLQLVWQLPRPGVGDDEARTRREQEADEVLSLVRESQDANLIAQLEAVDAFYRGKSPDDLPLFEKAVDLASASPASGVVPQVSLMYAEALRRASQTDRFEQQMWKLLSDFPQFDDAYVALFEHYLRNASAAAAIKVLNTWIHADPQSLRARAMYANVMLDARQYAVAEVMIGELLDEYPDEREVLDLYLRLCVAMERLPAGMDRLEAMRHAQPGNGAIVIALFSAYINGGNTPAALNLLESATEAAATARRANLLYFIAQTYHEIQERELAAQTLTRTLQVDPGHVPASNDQAYFWSEDGKNLSQSEKLARHAVAAEPDNPAYLDTLGWVLYKQGRFAEALELLRRAVSVATTEDPTLLDHLGDAMYRTGNAVEAADNWQRAMRIVTGADNPGFEGTPPQRPEYAQLRTQLSTKLRQRINGEEVDVSPVGNP